MARWEPGTAERLQQAALELFTSQGFERTTAAEIAESVGLTERTFFRHFPDKREVLFRGQTEFEGAFLDAVAATPPDASPMAVVGASLRGVAGFFPDERRDWSRMRNAVIADNPALLERERHKLAMLGEAIADALRGRGVSEPTATLAAQSGVTVFSVSFARWIAEGETRSLAQIAQETLGQLAAVAGDV